MSNYLASDDPVAAPNKVFASLSPFDESYCTQLEARRPGHLMALASAISASIDTRLRKRYVVPFVAPYNIKLQLWVADLLTPRAYLSLGVRPTDEQQVSIIEAAKLADAEIKEAADATAGLFDLPLRANTSDTGIVEPVTLSVSEQSPYTSRHKQYDAVKGNRRYG
jgi:hypothetical protein